MAAWITPHYASWRKRAYEERCGSDIVHPNPEPSTRGVQETTARRMGPWNTLAPYKLRWWESMPPRRVGPRVPLIEFRNQLPPDCKPTASCIACNVSCLGLTPPSPIRPSLFPRFHSFLSLASISSFPRTLVITLHEYVCEARGSEVNPVDADLLANR